MLGRAEVDEAGTIRSEVRVAAPRDFVFPYLTQPDKMARWIGRAAELDPTPGGVFRLAIQPPTGVVSGRFVEVLPPARLVFTWGWESDGALVPPGSSTVEVDLIDDGGATVVRVTHHGVHEDQRSWHGDGWSHYLPRLAVAATGGDPGPDPWST